MRRWLSPFGLALALAFLWLPFLMGSPLPVPLNPIAATARSITYTGSDLAFGGTATVLVPGTEEESYKPTPISDEMMYGHPQPRLPGSVYGVIAVGLICIGILASLIPARRVRDVASAAAALLGSLGVLAMEFAQRREVTRMLAPLLGFGFPSDAPGVADFVSLRYGFWIMMALLVAIGFAHVSAAVPRAIPRVGSVAGRE